MVDFGKILGKKEKESDEEESDEEDIDDLLDDSDEDMIGGEDLGDMDSGGGIGPQSGGGMSIPPDIRDDINQNEEEIREIKTELETIDETVENMDDRVKDIEDDISQLLDVYEMVTAEFNPFLDSTDVKEKQRESEKTEIDLGVSMQGGPSQQPSTPSLEEIPGPDQQSPQQSPTQQQVSSSQPKNEQKSQDQPKMVSENYQPQQEGPSRQAQSQDTERRSEPAAAEPSKQKAPTEKPSEIKPSKYIPKEDESEPEEETDEEKYTDEDLNYITDQFEEGSTYLIEDETLDFAYDIYSKLVDADTKALCVTRKHPEKIQSKYDIKDSDFVWMSTSNEPIAVGPQQLDVLSLTMERFLSDDGDVIMIDGLEYLFSNNPISTIIQFLQSIQDQIITSDTALIFAACPSSIEDKYYTLLKNELDPKIFSLLEKQESSEKKGSQKGDETEDLVNDMKNMVNYLEEEEKELEEKVEQIGKISSTQKSPAESSEVVMDAINSLRDEITSLRDRIDQEEKTTEEPSIKPAEKTKSSEDKIREVIEEQGSSKDEEKLSDEHIEDIIDLVKEKIRTDRENYSDIPEEYIEKIIEEVKKELEEEAQEKLQKKERESEAEVLEDTSRDTSVEEEIQEPTVGDIMKTITEEKEKTEQDEKKSVSQDEKVKIEKGLHIKGSVESEGEIVLKDGSVIDGDVISRNDNVAVGENCVIKGSVRGLSVEVSKDSEIEEIDAKRKVVLGKNVNVNRVSTEGDIELHQGVTVEEKIEYGDNLLFKGDDIKVGNLIHPIKDKEVVDEQWVSQ